MKNITKNKLIENIIEIICLQGNNLARNPIKQII